MKRIAKTVLALSLAMAANAGMAADSSSYPKGSEWYPTMAATATGTYADRHQGDVVRQAGSAFPPGAESFPTMARLTVDTFKHQHHNDVVNQASVPGPLDADEAPSYWTNHAAGGAVIGATSAEGAQGETSGN